MKGARIVAQLLNTPLQFEPQSNSTLIITIVCNKLRNNLNFPGKQSREESDNDALNSVDDDDDEEQGNYGVSAYGMSAASGTNASGSKRGLPKLREILRRQKQDSEDEDTPGKRFHKIYFRD